METLDFVNLARSKDKTRPYLLGAFRDTNAFVATDGHRMHYVENLPDATPMHMNGESADSFPEWKLPISQLGKQISEVIIRLDTQQVKTLKKLAETIKLLGHKNAARTRIEVCDGCNSRTILKLSYKDPEGSLELSWNVKCEVEGDWWESGLNLSYLVDALAPVQSTISVVKIQFYGGDEKPMIVTTDNAFKALICPMRE